MGKGRQALDMNSEHSREGVGLGVTELRELGRDVLDGAVPLAQLDPGQGGARSHGSGRGGESVGGQCGGKRLGSGHDILACPGELGGKPLLELGDAFAGELTHGIDSGTLGQEPQGRGGHVVVVAVQAGVTRLGQHVCAGGPAASATGSTGGGGVMLLDGALVSEQVQMATDRGGCQPQAGGKGGRGERAVLGDRLPNPVPGARLKNVRRGGGPCCTVIKTVVRYKHKGIVT